MTILVWQQLGRLLITAIAGMSIFLGYRLFYVAKQKQGELSVGGTRATLKLVDVAPGIYFALFGSAIICVSLFRASEVVETVNETSVGRVIERTGRGIGPTLIAESQPPVDFENLYIRVFEPNTDSKYVSLLMYRALLRPNPITDQFRTMLKVGIEGDIKQALGGVPRSSHGKAGSNRSLARMDCVGVSFMIKNRHAPTCAHGRPMASSTGCVAEAKGWARGDAGRSRLHRGCAVSS